MGQVNSYGESRASERVFGSMRARRGEQPAVKLGRIPGLLRPVPRTERVSPKGVLADAEDSNSRYLMRRIGLPGKRRPLCLKLAAMHQGIDIAGF
jgi:hypothetical protein